MGSRAAPSADSLHARFGFISFPLKPVEYIGWVMFPGLGRKSQKQTSFAGVEHLSGGDAKAYGVEGAGIDNKPGDTQLTLCAHKRRKIGNREAVPSLSIRQTLAAVEFGPSSLPYPLPAHVNTSLSSREKKNFSWLFSLKPRNIARDHPSLNKPRLAGTIRSEGLVGRSLSVECCVLVLAIALSWLIVACRPVLLGGHVRWLAACRHQYRKAYRLDGADLFSIAAVTFLRGKRRLKCRDNAR